MRLGDILQDGPLAVISGGITPINIRSQVITPFTHLCSAISSGCNPTYGDQFGAHLTERISTSHVEFPERHNCAAARCQSVNSPQGVDGARWKKNTTAKMYVSTSILYIYIDTNIDK